MAFPFIADFGFETGAHGMTASSGSLINVRHYSHLANRGMAPYRGAYALEVALAGGTTSQFVREDTLFDDLDANGTDRYLRWYFYLGKNFTMADTDKFSMVEIESTLDTTTEVAAGISRSGSNILFWYNETQAAASAETITLGTTTTALGKWYCAELKIEYDNAANNDGAITGYINDVAGTAISSLNQADAVNVKFGAIGPDAGTSGSILLDDIKYDDTQIYSDLRRFRTVNGQQTQASDHPVIGPGRFSLMFTDTGTTGVCTIYDSDGVPNRLEPIAVIRNLTANEMVPSHDILEVTHGAYVVISGTAPQAFFSIDRGQIASDAAYIARGRQTRRPEPNL